MSRHHTTRQTSPSTTTPRWSSSSSIAPLSPTKRASPHRYAASDKRMVAAALAAAFPTPIPPPSSSVKKKTSSRSLRATKPSTVSTSTNGGGHIRAFDASSAPPSGSNIWLVSGDSLCQRQIPVEVACQSRAIRNMLAAGPSLEASEGKVVLPSIKGAVLHHVIAFMMAHHTRIRYIPPRDASTPVLLQLMMAAHYLDLPALQRRAARAVAAGFNQLDSFAGIADDMIPFILRWCDALQLCRAERMLTKIQLGYISMDDAWLACYARLQRTSPVLLPTLTNVTDARRMCMQLQLQKIAARYVPTRLLSATIQPTIVTDSSTPTPASSTSSPSPIVTDSNALATNPSTTSRRHVTRQQLRAASLLLGGTLDRFQLVNGLLDEHAFAELLSSMPSLTALSCAGIGISKAHGLTLARHLRVTPAIPPLGALNLTRCSLSHDGIRAIAASLTPPPLPTTAAPLPSAPSPPPPQIITASPRSLSISSSVASGSWIHADSLVHHATLARSSSTASILFPSSWSSSPPPNDHSSSPTSATAAAAVAVAPLLVLPSLSLHRTVVAHAAAVADVAAAAAASENPLMMTMDDTKTNNGNHGGRKSSIPASKQLLLDGLPTAMTTIVDNGVRLPKSTNGHHIQYSHRTGVMATVASSSSSTVRRGSQTSGVRSSFDYTPTTTNGSMTARPIGVRAIDLPALAKAVQGHHHSNGSQTARASTSSVSEPIRPSQLMELVLADNPLGDVAVTAIAEAHINIGLRWLHTLHLSGNTLGYKAALMIADALQRQHSLVHLFLDNCELTARGVIVISQSIRTPYNDHHTIRTLDMSSNMTQTIDGASSSSSSHTHVGDAISQLLVHAKCLQSFAFGNNYIRAACLETIAYAVARAMPLIHLNWSSITIHDGAALALSSALSPHASLRHLVLYRCNLSSRGISELAAMLAHNTTITNIDLRGNEMDSEAAHALGTSLAHNTCLRWLNINAIKDGTRMRAEGCTALVRGLAHNTTLTRLSIAGHGIRNSGCASLAAILSHATALLRVDLRANNITVRGALALVDALTRIHQSQPHRPLLQLDLRHNALGTNGSMALRTVCRTSMINATGSSAVNHSDNNELKYGYGPESSFPNPSSSAAPSLSPASRLRSIHAATTTVTLSSTPSGNNQTSGTPTNGLSRIPAAAIARLTTSHETRVSHGSVDHDAMMNDAAVEVELELEDDDEHKHHMTTIMTRMNQQQQHQRSSSNTTATIDDGIRGLDDDDDTPTGSASNKANNSAATTSSASSVATTVPQFVVLMDA